MKLISTAWILTLLVLSLIISCNEGQVKNEKTPPPQIEKEVTARDILGNPDYQAISYGGYRTKTRDVQPSVEELKEDMKILQALNIKVLRTYNVHLAHASNVLKAIRELKAVDDQFEMYVMLGAWIDCENAWTPHPNHEMEDSVANTSEIKRVVELANQYPDIVKVIAVGNEAMIRWAESYYVQPNVILKWVKHLQDLKRAGKLPGDLWITCSDDFASWGGGDPSYRVRDLEDLIQAVDYVSMHTYPYHNTHYNPEFWGIREDEAALSDTVKVKAAMDRALQFAKAQFKAVSSYVHSIDSKKTVHIGETGWATISDGHYGPHGSKATDEFKEALFYDAMRAWTNEAGISCFYFEAFDEPWKDSHNPKGSENHFGLFTVDGKAKYVLWDAVDRGLFDGLTRNGNPITKTYDGDKNELLKDVELPAVKSKVAVEH
jgi:exo-beta-1,3-glucanase (GH17 family)